MQEKIAFMGTPTFFCSDIKKIYIKMVMKFLLFTLNHLENQIGDKSLKNSPIHSFAETINFNVRTPDLFKK